MPATQPAGKNPAKAQSQAEELQVSHVVSLLNSARRILERLSEQPVFQENGVGVSEWAFLHALEGGDVTRAGQIALRLGVSPQRCAQIVSSLSESGLISATSSADDSRKKDLALTDKGRSTLKPIDDKMLELFRSAFADRPQAVRATRQNLVLLGKALKGGSAEEEEQAE